MTTINRTEYMNGTIDHDTYYLAIADAIGRRAVESLVRRITDIEEIRAALATDEHLNNIGLVRWDRLDENVRALVRMNAQSVMAISWDSTELKPGTFCWSLAESVCVLKAVARRMVQEKDKPND